MSVEPMSSRPRGQVMRVTFTHYLSASVYESVHQNEPNGALTNTRRLTLGMYVKQAH